MQNEIKHQWVLASNNAGKLKEFDTLLSPLNIHIRPQKEFAVEDAIEDGLSFIENAIIKARHAANATGLPALADDSGLEVDALNGEPGIYSARYAATDGQAKSDQANIEKLLSNLNGVTDRSARFHCVLAFVRHHADPTPLIVQGTWNGEILAAPAGEGGFGYDPVFWVPDRQCSAAELSKEVKNTISHRGQAVRQFIERIKRLI